MPLDTVPHTLDVLYRILYAYERLTGSLYTDAWDREGGVNSADMIAIRTGYNTFKKTFTARGVSQAGVPVGPPHAPVRGTFDPAGDDADTHA